MRDVVNGLDGFSRRNRARYDTPTYGGFSLATSAGESDRQDLALKFGRAFGRTKLAAQFAVTSIQRFNPDTVNSAHGDAVNGSAGIYIPGGLTLSGSLGAVLAKESGREDPHYYYFKPGYQREFFHVGPTAFSVDMGRYFDFAQNHDAATAYGVQFFQNFTRWDLAMYLGYRFFKLHRAGSEFNDLNLVETGAYYRF